MDTMKILLGATIALLLGAVGLSWYGMHEGTKDASQGEIERLKQQIAEYRYEQDKLTLERQLQKIRAEEPATVTPPPITPSERDNLKAELAAKEAELARIADEKAKAVRDANVLDAENLELGKRDLEKSDSELRRARLIGDALLIGRIKVVQESDGFVVFEVVMPENVQPSSVLAIRRQTGIIGQIKVSSVAPDGAIGNLMPGFGSFKPQAGDELILPPP